MTEFISNARHYNTVNVERNFKPTSFARNNISKSRCQLFSDTWDVKTTPSEFFLN